MEWPAYESSASWEETPLGKVLLLRLGPTAPLGAGFSLLGLVGLRRERRVATIQDLAAGLNEARIVAARDRLGSTVAAAARAVYIGAVSARVDPAALRFRLEAADEPHPAGDPQLRLRIVRGVVTWLRSEQLRTE
jgi:hypothetical protein